MIFINNIGQLKNQNPNPGTEFYNLQTGHEYVYTGTEYVCITKSIPTNGLVTHLTMNNVSGTTIIDETGNYNGTITGATQVDGIVDKCMYYDGSNDYSTHANPLTTSNATISFFIKQTGSYGFDTVLFNTVDDVANRLSLAFPWYTTNICYFDWGNIASNGRVSFTWDSAWNENWVHVAISNGSNGLRVYVNGALIAENDGNKSNYDFTFNSFFLGRYSNAYAGCYISQFRIYTKELDNGEIYALSKELSN